ncbi:MAG: ferritin family protein [Candidatus Brocadiia bacterium]
MPEFLNPFSGITPDRKMTERELARAIRLSLAAEQEAVHLYEALADATDNELAAKVLQDIADEEKEHTGEFYRLLDILLPDDHEFREEGAEEVDEMAEELGED